MKLACVVVFYNPTKKNIANIYNYIDSLDRIYVVDNSNDNVIRIKEDNKIKYIKLKENLGIAKALNIGCEKAIGEDYNWLLTLDQDSEITPNIINKMKKYIVHNQTKINIGLVSPYQEIFSKETAPNTEYEEMIDIMTSGNIINLNAYKKIGGFKDWLFIDLVDTDYCMNLSQNGYKVIRLNRIVMKHNLGNLKVHKFLGKEYPCYNHNPIRRYYIVRNTFYLKDMYEKIYPDYIKHLIRVQKGQVKRILLFEKNKFQKLKMMYKGYKDYKKGIKGKLK